MICTTLPLAKTLERFCTWKQCCVCPRALYCRPNTPIQEPRAPAVSRTLYLWVNKHANTHACANTMQYMAANGRKSDTVLPSSIHWNSYESVTGRWNINTIRSHIHKLARKPWPHLVFKPITAEMPALSLGRRKQAQGALHVCHVCFRRLSIQFVLASTHKRNVYCDTPRLTQVEASLWCFHGATFA